MALAISIVEEEPPGIVLFARRDPVEKTVGQILVFGKEFALAHFRQQACQHWLDQYQASNIDEFSQHHPDGPRPAIGMANDVNRGCREPRIFDDRCD